MTESLPLLMFPQKRIVPPKPGRPMVIAKPHFPSHLRQVERIDGQLEALQTSLAEYPASLSPSLAGFEPENVLVMEIVGSLEDFKQAIEAVGLEWLGEWDLEDLAPDEDFYQEENGNRIDKPLGGRLFLSMSNQAGLQELLRLWQCWKDGEKFPRGKGKWKHLFTQLRVIRRWGIDETLRETGMIKLWEEYRDPINPDQPVTFQIELFHRKQASKRAQNERAVSELLTEMEGRTLGPFFYLPDIAFHAVKAELPARCIQQLLSALDHPEYDGDIQLFKFPNIMYFRPTGQSLATTTDIEGEPAHIDAGPADLPPVAALLDGAPLLMHDALKNRVLLHDLFDLERHYQPGERKHGTSMASLILNGELGAGIPLARQLYCVPVMQPDSGISERAEHVPNDKFFEDRIHLAVKQMFEGANNEPPLAPAVKIINLSICDPARPFIRIPSPWARLLDWLSWKYRVLFCVSAGNVTDDLDLERPWADFSALGPNAQIQACLQALAKTLSSRRLLSPAESINALTVGALHHDDAGIYAGFQRVDLLPEQTLPSPAMRFGFGFRRAIKPEVLFPGGRKLFQIPYTNATTRYRLAPISQQPPGQKVAWDSKQPGALSNTVFTCGTSNATALATRGAIRIHDMLDSLREQQHANIPDNLLAVLIKTLLVHGAKQADDAKAHLAQALKTSENSRQFKRVIARYMGYGAVDIERVLVCTEQRATVLGCGEIKANEVHEYDLPLPVALSARKHWRRLIVTLAWFTPINPDHRNLREAKLSLEPGAAWNQGELRLQREDGDHHQVLRGTVQHEILEGDRMVAAYVDGTMLRLRVACKKDAANTLDEAIPYGLAVTLQVKEDLPIYTQIRSRLKPSVAIGAL